jgi:hypothetical protein
VAELPNDQIIGIRVNEQVYVDLKNAKVFSPPEAANQRSDELASL